RRRIVSKLRAQSKCPITQQIVPTLRGLLLEGSADVGLLLFLSRIVGDPEELNGVGLSGGSRQAPHCYSKLGIRLRSPAKVSGVGSIVEGTAGNAVSGVEAGKVREIIELLLAPTKNG